MCIHVIVPEKNFGASRRALHLISRSQKATKSAYACFIVEANNCRTNGDHVRIRHFWCPFIDSMNIEMYLIT